MLEESLLHLLRNTGYITIENKGNDPTLIDGSAGLKVKGRGGNHQIDAIADYKATPPFCNPLRLLVEGKFEKEKTGLQIIRNAVGVLKDLQEYFVPADNKIDPSRLRYHYTYAIFSANEYTNGAQKYAFAQDIYLIPIARSKFFKPISESIINIMPENFGELNSNGKINVILKDLRKHIRRSLRNYQIFNLFENNIILNQTISNFIYACKKIDLAYLAIAGKSFPILLIPNPDISKDKTKFNRNIKLYWDNEGWYINDNEQKLFSFDLPEELFNLYATQGVLTQSAALDLKQTHLSEFRILSEVGNEFKITSLKLDDNWINEIRDRLNSREDSGFTNSRK